MMERVLITGAAGFTGSHLCERFVAEGFKVEAMDNFITGDLKNIAHLLNIPVHLPPARRYEYIDIEGDLDHILHFASPASPIDYLKIPVKPRRLDRRCA